MKPESISKVVNGKRYSTDNATLVAHDAYWDGRNFERNGRNTFLYRTEHGNWFVVNQSQWDGERTQLTPVIESRALELYFGSLEEHEVAFEDAFPGVSGKIEEA